MDTRAVAGRRPEALPGPRLSRRSLIGIAAAGVLTACSAPSAQGPPRSSTAPDARAPQPSAETTPAGTAPPEPEHREVTRAEIVARYAGVAPVAWGLDVPGVVTRLPTLERVVALTFDACGGPRGSGYDAALIDTLRATRTRATLFLNDRWVRAHPDITAELARDPLFEIANHGTAHRPLSVTGRSAYGIAGTADAGEVYDEITGSRELLSRATGAAPRFFRSGTAHYDDVAVRIARDLGEAVVNFDVNGDAGATSGPQEVARALGSAVPGSIVLCHMNQPASGTAGGVATAVPRLADAGFRFVHLSEYQL